MELTGLSSRVIAKLAKNETVTTDTIAKICTALSCDVNDVMECTNESTLSLYQYSRKYGKTVEENENIRKMSFVFNGRRFAVYYTKKNATKGTRIYCENDGAVYWEQLMMMGGMCTPSIEKHILVKPKKELDEELIVVIKGKPSVIVGLDEGRWASARSGKANKKDDIFVMSETAFKLFEIK